MSGVVRSFAIAVLASASLIGATGAATLDVRRFDPGSPALAPAVRTQALTALERRVERWRSVPDVISRPGADWSPWANRRAGWRPPAPSLRDRRDLRGAAATGVRTAASPADTYHVAFIRIDFTSDRNGSESTGDGRFNLDPADTLSNPVDRPPHNRTFFSKHHEALARYYDAQGYGRVVISGEVWPRTENDAYHCTDMADFGPWQFSQDIEGAAVSMFHRFVVAADTQSVAAGDSIPWSDIDRIVFIHAGSDLQSDVRSDSKLDIPSFTLTVGDSDAVYLRDPGGSLRTRPIQQATFIPETANQDGYYGAINGVIAHECGHLIFGYVDLYNVETGFPVVGLWSLMDSGNLAGALVRLASGEEIFATGLLPPSVDPFHRFFTTDALDIPEADYGRVDSLKNSERHPDMRRITLSSDEYLLLENRYLSGTAGDSVQLDQDSTTRVVLGPKTPDRYEYDSLTPGGGILVWHVDESVIPFETSLRPNPGFGANTRRSRLGVKVIEADGLDDIGDLGSPFILGSYRDPWYVGNQTVLDDDGTPNLRANTGTRPHVRFEALDTLLTTMRFRVDRAWQKPGWPVSTFPLGAALPGLGEFPKGGPQLLAVDADGDGKLEVCWAGADSASSDSTGLFAVRPNGAGLGSSRLVISLDRRPRPVLAALPRGGPRPEQGPALFAVTTYADGPADTDAGGDLWVVDHLGFPYLAPWPIHPPGTKFTTPPVFVGPFSDARVLAGAADGFVYAYALDGTLWGRSSIALAGGVTGRLAVARSSSGCPIVAAGGAGGQVAVFAIPCLAVSVGAGAAPVPFTAFGSWPQTVSTRPGFAPDFLWLDLDGDGGAAGDPSGCGAGNPELVVRDADRLWGFCLAGRPLPGWGRSFGDTLAPGLGAGDPDGDGFPEVLVQTHASRVAFVNLSGGPSPGWPKAGSPEGVLYADTLLTGLRDFIRFPSLSAPLAVDVDGTGRTSVVTLNTSGILTALDRDGRKPQGWPLATGAGAAGAPLVADLDRDGLLELVAPDRFGTLYCYALPADTSSARATAWTMLGGDPQRSCWLPPSRTSLARSPSRGPVVAGSVKAFPNPARRRPVTIAYTLTEPARVDVRVLDTSGQEVAAFSRDGRMAENLETWNPGAVPAGLYLVHVRIRGSGSESHEVVPVGILK